MIPNYNKKLNKFSKQNRKNPTYGEMKLWSKLKSKQFLNLKFRRQYIFEKYIIDFYCIELKLGIEIDGFSHDIKYEEDREREIFLKTKGVNLIRFTEYEVKSRIDDVMQSIENFVEDIRKN